MMRFPLFLQAFLLGLQHSFEPDHMAAVSVLASDKRNLRQTLWPVLWRSSQWALGHGFTLMLLSLMALVFKSSLPESLSHFVEVWVIGPMMIGLGVMAIWRAFTLYSHVHQPHQPTTHEHAEHHHDHSHTSPVHSHLPPSRITVFNRSFGVGMLHGVAGTGGALAIALGLAADSVQMALWILVLESIGILFAMGLYSLLLVFAMKRLAGSHSGLLKGINIVVGLLSIGVGCLWIYNGFFA